VVNDGNDSGQLHAMAQAAKRALGAAALTAAADTGYSNSLPSRKRGARR
jgi:hypothetical protein